MGKRSDRRRREKQRVRERAWQAERHAPGWSGASRRDGPAFTPDLVEGVIDAALSSCSSRDTRGLDNAVTVLAAGPSGADGPAMVDRALGLRLIDAVGQAWGRGWQPADLARVIERELGRRHGGLGADAIVHDTRRYEPGAVPPRWQAQVDDLDRGRGSGSGSVAGTGAGAGAAASGSGAGDARRWAVAGPAVERPSAIRVVVETVSFVGRLPRVPKLGPAPGDAGVRTSGGPVAGQPGRGGVDARILHRVRSLLAKAESTTFPDEAEALTAKAQELMARHAIDAAVLDAERGDDRPYVGGRRVAVDDPYAGPKAMLLEAISAANRCRSVWSKGFGYATVFGTEGDLDAVELLYTSLLVQAARAMLAEGNGDGRVGGRTRSFRQSFLVAFATRIGVRLRDAVDAATEAYADQHDTLLPVLADRRDAAEAACDETFPRVRATSVSANDWWGWQAGNDAAEAAQLDVHAPVGRGSP
jgi:hypothetical protein